MDFLFKKKKMVARAKPTMGMFKKSVPIVPSMMRRQLLGFGGAGVRPLIGAGGAGIRKIIFK